MGNSKKPRKVVLKKKAIRKMRSPSQYRKNKDGKTISSHRMEWTGPEKKRRGDFTVYPSIAPKKGVKPSHSPSAWTKQNSTQAAKRGEAISVKRRKRAEKLAAGSWKQGIDRKEAMSAYREQKKHAKEQRKNVRRRK